MLKYGQEQENVFEIVEKGNFFTPTKGEDNADNDLEKGAKHDQMVKVLKTTALLLGIVGFAILGCVVLSDFLR